MYWCVIPFRKGSKRIKNKNIKDFCGRPLVWWTVGQALDVFKDSNIIISTDIDPELIPHFIPEVETDDILLHKRSKVPDDQPAKEYISQVISSFPIGTNDDIVLLQPTCPCREPQDIRNAMEIYETLQYTHLVSVQEFTEYDRMYTGRGYDFASLLSRYNLFENEEKLYVRNSSIYIFSVSAFIDTGNLFGYEPAIYVMPRYKSIDINTYMDFALAQWVYSNKSSKEMIKWKPIYL